MAGRYDTKKNLSLLDLVVVVAGLLFLLSLVLLFLKPLIKSSKHQQTLKTIGEAREAVIAFAASQKRLPSPEEFSTITRHIDAWGGTLFYLPDGPLTASENICCTATAGLEITEKERQKKGIAFVIVSEGKNRQNDTGTGPVFTVSTGESDSDDLVEYSEVSELRKMVACSSLAISPDVLPDAVEDAPYGVQLTANSVCPNVSPTAAPEWSFGKGTLPPGLTLNQNGNIIGTPDTAATPKGTLAACQIRSTFTVFARHLVGLPAEKEFTLSIVPQKLKIPYLELPPGIVSGPYTAALTATGGQNAYTWNMVSGSLPSGLSLNSSTGVISGTIAPGSEGIYPFTVELSDGCGKTSRKFTMTADTCIPLLLSSAGQITANTGKPIHHVIKISGGQAPYFPMVDGCTNNCTQFNLDLQCTDREVILSGTPLTPGSCTLSVSLQDSCPTGAQTVRKSYIVNIQAAP